MTEFLKVVNYKTAIKLIRESIPQKGKINKKLLDSIDYTLAEAIISDEDVPEFNRSTVDGYAIKAKDSYGSSESSPQFFNYKGSINIGEEIKFNLEDNECCWIPTGGMLPEGADSVVMVEYTERLGEDTILVYRPVAPLENIIQKGEDVKKGKEVFSVGKKLRPQDIGLLASLGKTTINVFKPYNFGIISTGDEIVSIDTRPQVGQVRDVNSYSIASAIKSTNNYYTVYPLVKDNFDNLKNVIKKGLYENDILIMSGGSSVGTMDLTLKVLLSFEESELLFHGIAVKPGKPTMAVKIGEKIVIGLPGHPVSALMIFYVICLQALEINTSNNIEGRIEINLPSQAGRDDFIPVQLINKENNIIVRPIIGKSGLMSILSKADGYVHISAEQQGLKANEFVNVTLFR